MISGPIGRSDKHLAPQTVRYNENNDLSARNIRPQRVWRGEKAITQLSGTNYAEKPGNDLRLRPGAAIIRSLRRSLQTNRHCVATQTSACAARVCLARSIWRTRISIAEFLLTIAEVTGEALRAATDGRTHAVIGAAAARLTRTHNS